MHQSQIWIVDFGSQYTQLITRKSRELGYSSEIFTASEIREKFENEQFPKTLILSGGPDSVFQDKTDYSFLFKNQSLPILGICYGMQVMATTFGGKVEKGHAGEYGKTTIHFVDGFQVASYQIVPFFYDHPVI